jgi:hypothetical protein
MRTTRLLKTVICYIEVPFIDSALLFKGALRDRFYFILNLTRSDYVKHECRHAMIYMSTYTTWIYYSRFFFYLCSMI